MSKRPSIPAPRKGKNSNRYQELLTVATEVFCHRGFSGATVQEIADRAGMLKGSLYHYIESKEDLLFRILAEGDARMAEIMVMAKAADEPPLDRVSHFIETLLVWYLNHIEYAKVFLFEWKHLTGERFEAQLRRRKNYENYVKGLVQSCQESGKLQKDLDVNLSVYYILGAINGVTAWYRREGRASPEAIANAYANMTVGLLIGTSPGSATSTTLADF